MATTNDIAARLLSDLQQDYGLTRNQAAGVVGNLMHESGGFQSLQEIKPLIPGSRGGYGYAQWTGPRRNAFESFASSNKLDPTSYDANYGFLKHELANDPYERRQFNTVKNATTASEAARLISENYLRPGIPHMDSRVNYANQVLGYAPSAGLPQVGPTGGPALNAINRAAPTSAPQNSLWSNPLGALQGFTAPMGQLVASPQMQQAAIGPLMSTAAGRNLISRQVQGMNIGAAPTVTQGHSGTGTRALAVGGAPGPVMLSGGRERTSSSAHGNMNMDVYRANAATLGGRGFTQDNINKALASGKTLYKLA
jgi:hypothetical protein